MRFEQDVLAAHDVSSRLTDTAVYAASVHALDDVTRHHTPFRSFREMVEADFGMPLLRSRTKPADVAELTVLANAYDHAQELRGDDRRAVRW